MLRNIQYCCQGWPGVSNVTTMKIEPMTSEATGPPINENALRLRTFTRSGATIATAPPLNLRKLNSNFHTPLQIAQRNGPTWNERSIFPQAQPANRCPSSWPQVVSKTASCIWTKNKTSPKGKELVMDRLSCPLLEREPDDGDGNGLADIVL